MLRNRLPIGSIHWFVWEKSITHCGRLGKYRIFTVFPGGSVLPNRETVPSWYAPSPSRKVRYNVEVTAGISAFVTAPEASSLVFGIASASTPNKRIVKMDTL